MIINFVFRLCYVLQSRTRNIALQNLTKMSSVRDVTPLQTWHRTRVIQTLYRAILFRHDVISEECKICFSQQCIKT